MRLVAAAAVIVLVVALVVGGLYFTHEYPFAKSATSSSALAPTFSVADIYGQQFSLASYRGSSVVLIEFTSLSCSECQIVEKSLYSLYAQYNQSGKTSVHLVSIYIEPQFGDTVPALKAYHAKNNITWSMAQDTPTLAVSTSYGVSAIPVVVVVDKQGHAVYDQSGAQSTDTLRTTVSSAQAGTAAAISIVTVSVFALAAVAGVTTFFSPCAFPMFPGYMSLFLGLNANEPEARSTFGSTYKGTARRAAVAGSITAIGMIVVFLIIGLALVLAANAISGYIPYLLVIVGALLVSLGALLLTNLQYWRIVTPLQNLWQRIRGVRPEDALGAAPAATGQGINLKLFSYGMGYAAAAAGCVAPVIFSAIVAGLALGLVGGIVNILIFTLTAAALMIVVTVLLAVAGKRYVNLLKAYTPVIKKISAGVLILVGFYLIYFYYTAWGF